MLLCMLLLETMDFGFVNGLNDGNVNDADGEEKGNGEKCRLYLLTV